MTEGIELVLVDSFAEAESFMRWLGERRDVLAFDLEASALDPWRDHIRLAQFGDANTAWAFPYADWRGIVKEVLETYEDPMVAFNAKFDVSFAEHDGIDVKRHIFNDPMLACHLTDSAGPKALKQACYRYLGITPGAQQELKQALKRNHWTWETVPIDFPAFWEYGALDTILAARLWSKLEPVTKEYQDAYERELAVMWILLDMETRGARIDMGYCKATSTQLLTDLSRIVDAYPDLNLFSTKQLAEALEAEGVTLPKTIKGNTSTSEAALEGVDHPLAASALEARRLKKIVGTYFEPFMRLQVDGRLHFNVNSLGAARTGRMSISRPSMQNIPRTAEVRNAITAREGHRLILADYQGQEARLLAHYANDTKMIEAFEAGVDIHGFVAEQIYGEGYTKEQRQVCKSGTFAILYGAQAKKLGQTIGITQAEARLFSRKYASTFPGVSKIMRETQQTARSRAGDDAPGWIVTLGGRRLSVPIGKEYVALNRLIQGGAADILKQALIDLDRSGLGEHLVLPIHDEIISEVPEEDAEDVAREIEKTMTVSDLRVELPVSAKIVERWGEAYS